MEIRPSVQRRALLFSVFAGPLAMLLSLAALIFVVVTKPPTAESVDSTITSYTKAEYFAKNFLLVWLAGGPKLNERFSEMSSASQKITLNPDPMTVTDINTTDVLKTPAGPETEWAFTLAATAIPPGGSMSRNFYRVTFVEKDGAFQAITLPRLTAQDSTPIRVDTVYTGGVDLASVLGKNVANFAKAYLVPGGAGNLGRYVSERFVGGPIANSPYTGVEITNISHSGDVDPTGIEAGGSLEIMVTVKASVSSTTFTTMQLPLRVSATANGQWLVEAITEPVDFGTVAGR